MDIKQDFPLKEGNLYIITHPMWLYNNYLDRIKKSKRLNENSMVMFLDYEFTNSFVGGLKGFYQLKFLYKNKVGWILNFYKDNLFQHFKELK